MRAAHAAWPARAFAETRAHLFVHGQIRTPARLVAPVARPQTRSGEGVGAGQRARKACIGSRTLCWCADREAVSSPKLLPLALSQIGQKEYAASEGRGKGETRHMMSTRFTSLLCTELGGREPQRDASKADSMSDRGDLLLVNSAVSFCICSQLLKNSLGVGFIADFVFCAGRKTDNLLCAPVPCLLCLAKKISHRPVHSRHAS